MAGFFAGGMFWMSVAVSILYIVAMWVVFQKAKKPGWAAIVPFYSTIVYLEVVERPWWWLLLLFVPIVNIVIGVIVTHDLSLAFKRDAWFTVGLLFLPWIFAPILAFGKDKYVKPKR
ncbi:signal peptidase I [Patescibacteria group bacterium]|nr:signal peptidase I [Patescibacteria group bacterium]